MLTTYSIQILLIVAAACALILVRARAPRFRLIYWRLVLLGCLLLPLAPARVIDADLTSETVVSADLTGASPRTHAAGRGSSPLPIAFWLIAGGAVARSLWLAVGLARLRSLKADGVPATLSDDLQILRRTLAPTADVRWHDRVPQPVTFGLRQAVILLPSRLRGLPADLQRAVLCHELLHASRGDWRSTLGEEAVRTMFWFTRRCAG